MSETPDNYETVIAVTDIETTGKSPVPTLDDPVAHRIYDIGIVMHKPRTFDGDVEYQWFIDLGDIDGIDLSPDGPNAEALRIGRFWERHPQAGRSLVYAPVHRERAVAEQLAELLDGQVLAGVNLPSFDLPFLAAMFARHGITPTWSYRHLEIGSYAAGAAGLDISPGLDSLIEEYRIAYSPAERHTGLGDARIERNLLDAARSRARAIPRNRKLNFGPAESELTMRDLREAYDA